MNTPAKVVAVNLEIERMVFRHLGRLPQIDNNEANKVTVDHHPRLTYFPYANNGQVDFSDDPPSDREAVGRPNEQCHAHDWAVVQVTQNNPERREL